MNLLLKQEVVHKVMTTIMLMMMMMMMLPTKFSLIGLKHSLVFNLAPAVSTAKQGIKLAQNQLLLFLQDLGRGAETRGGILRVPM